ncbi:hypothetical protein DFH06DRAFT_1230449 [Mycena polygramma]|nr:hypothetical protein DFH06DRAFT_1230449 [Mycena polygramma]
MAKLGRQEDRGTGEPQLEQRREQEREDQDQDQESRRSRGTTTGYKGKALRSWPQLPPEVIRLIATYYLHALAGSLPLPAPWDVEAHIQHVQSAAQAPHAQASHAQASHAHIERHGFIPWREARMYTVMRDTKALEPLMCVCSQWGVAVEYHHFWHDAIGVLDPTGTNPFPTHARAGSRSSSNAHGAHATGSSNPALGLSNPALGSSLAAPPSPYTHFRALLTTACVPCLINTPHLALGLHRAVRTLRTVRSGVVGCVGSTRSADGRGGAGCVCGMGRC